MLSIESLLAIAVIAAALFVTVTRRFLATGALIGANVVVHLINVFGRQALVCVGGVVCDDSVHTEADVLGLRSIIHQELGLHGDWLAAGDPMAFLQVFTSMFVHADFLHLLGNVIVLVAFALPFEERIGHRAFLGIYLASGIAAAFAQMATHWGAPILMMGASGAVFGIIGAFAGAYPNLVMPLPLPLGFILIFVRMRVLIAAGVFAGQQLLFQYFSSYNPDDRTAYFAHFGGLLAGLLLGITYVRTKRQQRAKPSPEAILDLTKLRPFGKTLAAQNALARLSSCLDDPQLAAIWGEKFLEHAECPLCATRVRIVSGNVDCTNGHRFDVRVNAAA